MSFENFITWEILATYAGSVAMTGLLTQLLKDRAFMAKVPTADLSYFIALIILLLATYFTVGLTISSAVLILFNAFIVSAASNGLFERVAKVLTREP